VGDCLFQTLSEPDASRGEGNRNGSFDARTDKSRGYCLEMICADFLAGANLDHGDPETLLFSMTRFFKFLPGEQRQTFLAGLGEKVS
jgi:hypothetical protein